MAALQDLLQLQGFRVTTLNQVGTIEELIALQADYFIIDGMLPIINGHNLCIILKSKHHQLLLDILGVVGSAVYSYFIY